MASRKRSLSNDADIHALHKEWDEASCPICMDHPHNAVLLLCSSYEKGCRPYICDTSYRHSNCLDRFKSLSEDSNVLSESQDISLNASDRYLSLRSSLDPLESRDNQNITESNSVTSAQLPGGSAENSIQGAHSHSEMQEGILQRRVFESALEGVNPQEADVDNQSTLKSSLRCPLCRGSVLGWKVIEEARKYLNLKPRSCSWESCTYFGYYRELRQHARRVHPTARPADIDPSRQRTWRHMEHQREYGDIVSAIRSAIPGSVVLGDYVIEHGERLSVERERSSSVVDAPWLSTLFLFQMIGSVDSAGEARAGRSRAHSRRHQLSTGGLSRRRYLWGENLLGLQYDDEDDYSDSNIFSDMGEDASPNPRRRRRLTGFRSDEDQQ